MDEKFDHVVDLILFTEIITDEFKEKARPLFREQWERAAVDGKVEFCDSLYVYVARKA